MLPPGLLQSIVIIAANPAAVEGEFAPHAKGPDVGGATPGTVGMTGRWGTNPETGQSGQLFLEKLA